MRLAGMSFLEMIRQSPSERVRYLLLGDASISRTRRVLDVLSASIYRKLGLEPKSFEALLQEIQESDTAAARFGFTVCQRGIRCAASARWKTC